MYFLHFFYCYSLFILYLFVYYLLSVFTIIYYLLYFSLVFICYFYLFYYLLFITIYWIEKPKIRPFPKSYSLKISVRNFAPVIISGKAIKMQISVQISSVELFFSYVKDNTFVTFLTILSFFPRLGAQRHRSYRWTEFHDLWFKRRVFVQLGSYLGLRR